MFTYGMIKRNGFYQRGIAALSVLAFMLTSIVPPNAYAQALPESLNLPKLGTMIAATEGYAPALIQGVSVNPKNPLNFTFYVNPGDSHMNEKQLLRESDQLIKYFLTTITTPSEDLWVNLSPLEKDNIVTDSFGATDMGRDLLAQDYVLKQLMSSLMYPEDELGQQFWQRVRDKAYQKFGTRDIPVDTYNKIWIVPERAAVYEKDGTAFVVKSKMKVMLARDYLALQDSVGRYNHGLRQVGDQQLNEQSELVTAIIEEVLIPEIEKEVNEGRTFARLRQVYNSMVLAAWYKNNLKESLLGQVYMDQNKIAGVDTDDPKVKEKIYQQYLKAFGRGVYNYIREEYDETTQQMIPRQYYSGGAGFETIGEVVAIETYRERDLDRLPRDMVAGIGEILQDAALIAVDTDLVEATANNEAVISQAFDTPPAKADAAVFAGLKLDDYPTVRQFVEDEVGLLQPDTSKVVVVDAKMFDRLLEQTIEQGLVYAGDDGNYYYYSHPKDTARAIKPTRVASDRPSESADPFMNQINSEEAIRTILEKMTGAHEGEITYVVPFINGKAGTATAFPGVQVTDNVHVVLQYFFLYNDRRTGIGQKALDLIEERGGDFLRISHATHPKGRTLDEIDRTPENDERMFVYFKDLTHPERASEVLRERGDGVVRLFGSGYGGNALGAKKFSLRYFNQRGVDSDDESMAHQFMALYYNKKTGKAYGVTGAYPSMGGKTNNGTIYIDESLEDDWAVYLVSEDLVRSYFRENPDGSVSEMAHNIEHGTFLVAEGINRVELQRAVNAIKKGGVFGVNLAYKFRYDSETGRRVVVESWWERHDKARPVQEVLREYIDERLGNLSDADKGVGWHDWKGEPIRRRLGRLLMGRRLTLNDLEVLEYALRDPAKAAILTDKKQQSEDLDDEQRIYDIVMEVLDKGWNEPNARISVPMENYDNGVGNIGNIPAADRPNIDPDSELGYEVNIRKFGGRQPSTEPLVRILPTPQMALYDAMMARSLKTAAEEKVVDTTLDRGEDPIAQKPFFATTIGRYFDHLLQRAKRVDITYAHNNFFRQHRGPDGRIVKGFVWPGFSANSRIDVWLIKYRLGQLRDDEYVETPIGLIPTPEASLFDGLREEEGGPLTKENIADLTRFDKDEWRWEIQVRTNFIINKLKMDIPDELRAEHEKLAKALDYTLPDEWYRAKSWVAMETEKAEADSALIAEAADRRGEVTKTVDEDQALQVTERERPDTTGGIDFNPALLDLQIERDGEGVPLPVFDQAPAVLENVPGFVPVIIDMTPVPSLPLLLGLSEMEKKLFAAGEDGNQEAHRRGDRPEIRGERLSRLYE